MGKSRKRKAQEAPSATPAPKKPHNEPKPAITISTPSKIPSAHFVEEPRGAALKREVEIYEQLSSQDETERLEAADAVVSGLLGGSGASEAVLTRHLERRLFRGLASGRKAARLGFSVVLAEILSQLLGEKELSRTRYTGLPFDKVLDVLKAKTKPEGDLSGQEERDHAFGLLFGLQCFVRAKILFVKGQEDGHWNKVLDNLLQLAKKKPWMREECGFVIVEALEQMDQSYAESTLDALVTAGLASSPEGVGLWLTARQRFPEMRFPKNPWGQSGNPLKHLGALAKVLKESSSSASKENGEAAKQTGNWHPQLHFVWDKVLENYLEDTLEGLPISEVDFKDFWRVVVDESLFSSSASQERKFWGFLVFQKALKPVSRHTWILRTLFTPNFMRCLINHLSHEDRFLHRAAERSLKALFQKAKSNPKVINIILPQLISENGVYNFDQITKSKTVDKLLSQLQEVDDVRTAINSLVLPIKEIKTSESVKDAEARRQTCGDYILSLIRHATSVEKTRDSNEVVAQSLLSQLAFLAYSNDEIFVPPISEKSRVTFRGRLMSAFAHLLSGPNGFSYPSELLQTFEPSAVRMDENISAAKEKALGVMKKLMIKTKKAAGKDKKPLEAFAMLYALVIFQLYNGECDAVSLLEELRLCYDKLVRGKEDKDGKSEASVVLVEILLSFMSKQSVLLRKIAQQVFIAFSDDITEESLKLLVDVLESSESLKGQQELFDQANDDLEVDDDDDEIGSDVEVLDANGINGYENSDASTETDREDDDNEEDDDEGEEGDDGSGEEDDEAQKLDDALAKALGTHRADRDLQEDSSDSDADMSDSEMIDLDTKLVEIFSQRMKQPNKKQEKKDARVNIINFKSRVLDLLEIYVKEQAGGPMAPGLLMPLLKLIRTTTAKQISERASNVITAFAKASRALKSTQASATFDRPHRFQVLKNIHEEASKNQGHAFSKAASTASLLVATSLFRASKGNRKKIAKIYHETEDNWAEGELKMQASFFHDWVNWCQSHVS